MSEARPATNPAPTDVAGDLREAPFVRFVATQTGDSLAAAGLLVRALQAIETPFKVETSDPSSGGVSPGSGPADATCVVIGQTVTAAEASIPGSPQPACATAYTIACELEPNGESDPVLALAGCKAAGSIPGSDGSAAALAAAEDSGRVSRQPGVAVPTRVWARDLSASTLLRMPESGDTDQTTHLLERLGIDGLENNSSADPRQPASLTDTDRRQLASLLAVEVTRGEMVSSRGAVSVERALRPYATDGLFKTVGGYADVLSALALEAPGQALALTLSTEGHSARDAAVDTWRRHGRAAHSALDEATIGRYDGAIVLRVPAPDQVLPTVARIARDFVSPEPAVIAVEADGESSADTTSAAVLATEPRDIGQVTAAAAAEANGVGDGTPIRGRAQVRGEPHEFIAAVRERL